MKFVLEVGGDTEKHVLEYQFDALWGNTVIKVDNEEVKSSKRWFNASRECHALDLGRQEAINVRIEREPKFFFGHRNCVFVNDRLVKCFE